MRWTGEEFGGVFRVGCRAGEEGRFFLARGRAGLTGQRQRRLVPPRFFLKTRCTPPLHPRASRSRVSPLSSAAILSITFPSPPFCSFPASPSSSSCSIPPFLSLPQPTPPPPPRSSSGPLQTLSSGLRGVGVGGCGGGMRRLRGTKAPRCSGPTRVAGFEKKTDSVLMQQVDGQTRVDRQRRLSPLSSSFNRGLFWPKKHIIRLVSFPSCLMFYQTH